MKSLITGEEWLESEFSAVVFRSFLETLVQFLYDLTRDINVYVHLGRALWPTYVQPILAENIGETLRAVKKGQGTSAMTKLDTQREILSLLDQKIFPHIRSVLEQGVAPSTIDSPPALSQKVGPTDKSALSHDLPHLAKYLLLAVYVCQVNRADKDKELFSIQTNGKRKRGSQTDTGEDVAFGSGQQHVKAFRPRTFPVERLYSLYVSMIGLNPLRDVPHDEHDEMLRSSGNVDFHETVAYLRDMGILHEYPKRASSDPIRFSQRSFWSSLTRDEATAIASSVQFPLERYIL
jgi:Origin recognition complex (ORC) subunit 5 C-terminus